MPQGLMRLTVETIDGILERAFERNAESLDLRDVRFVDPYALLVLDLLALEMTEQRCLPRIEWPESQVVRRWMHAMGFFAETPGAPCNRSLPSPARAGSAESSTDFTIVLANDTR
jgi:hypothetical protein